MDNLSRTLQVALLLLILALLFSLLTTTLPKHITPLLKELNSIKLKVYLHSHVTPSFKTSPFLQETITTQSLMPAYSTLSKSMQTVSFMFFSTSEMTNEL
jgi:hypothetical protein